MVEDTLRKFELNSDSLDDFDALMSRHLDQIEELVVNNIDTKSKLLNIVGLCINIKTLIIEGDERTNVNVIIANICNPDLLQNLVLDGVKIPSSFSFKKLTSLRMLSLNNIRSCSATAALTEIVNPEKIEALNFERVDFGRASIDCIKAFPNLKYLNLIRVQNCKLDNLEFLSEMPRIEKLNIEKNAISFEQIENLMKCKFNKQVSVELPTAKNEKVTNYLEISENGKVFVTINNKEFEALTSNLNLYKVHDIVVIFSKNDNLKKYIHALKQVKGSVNIAVKDLSCLSAREAKQLKEDLKIDSITLVDFDEALQYERSRCTYSIDKYMQIRTELDDLLSEVEEYDDELLKFLDVYRILIDNIYYDEFADEEEMLKKPKSRKGRLENCFVDYRAGDKGFAEALKNALACMDIEAKVVKGKIIEPEKAEVWNQVKILDTWYNVDIGLDSKNNENKKKFAVNYCLLSNEDMRKTHIPEVANNEYCPTSIEKKVISSYYKESFDIRSYIENILDKIKAIFRFNKRKALPSAQDEDEE